MRAFVALALLLAPVAARAGAADTPYSLPRSSVFAVRSPAGDTYEVMAAWPEGDPPEAGWPVLYVLDGEESFAIAVLTARRLARAGARSGVAPGVVVGIAAGPLARRVRDYTPPAPGYRIPAGQPASGLETGGGEAFLDLVEERVMPAVRERWRVDRTRETLAGHSFGGLIALHALLDRPRLFEGAVAISPSLWFGDGVIQHDLARRDAGVNPRRLLLAEGDERAPANNAALSSSAIAERLQATVPAMRARFLNLPGQSHGTTFLAAIAPAINFAFGRSETGGADR